MTNTKKRLAEIISIIDNQQQVLKQKDPITGTFLTNSLEGEVSKTNNHEWLVGEIRKLHEECE